MTKNNKAALSERVCLGALDKHANTLRVQRGVNLYVIKSQMQRRIKRTTSLRKPKKPTQQAAKVETKTKTRTKARNYIVHQCLIMIGVKA